MFHTLRFFCRLRRRVRWAARLASSLLPTLLTCFITLAVSAGLALVGVGCSGDEPASSPTVEPAPDAGKAGKRAGKAGKRAGKAGDHRRPGDAPAASSGERAGYITFAINVHDWLNIKQSAGTMLRLMDIYESHGVKGDFYLTAPMVYAYTEHYPQVIERLKSGGHTISYHGRAPHPMTYSFSFGLREMSDADLAQAMRDYETYKLDMSTGELDRSQPGGFTYVKQVLGTTPVVAGGSCGDDRVDAVAYQTYRSMGATMMVDNHEEGTDPDDPYQWVEGLLARPSTFSVTRWGESDNGKGSFWWDGIHRAPDEYDPAERLQSQMASYDQGGTLFVTSLIHENNFYHRGATPWSEIYYTTYTSTKRIAAEPPYELDVETAGTIRSQEQQDTIWAAYDEMVGWAAANMNVITSKEVYRMSKR